MNWEPTERRWRLMHRLFWFDVWGLALIGLMHILFGVDFRLP